MSAASAQHERTDASPRVVGLIAAAVAVGIGACLLAARGIIAAGSRAGAPPLGGSGQFTHGPDERTGIAAEWPAIAAETREHLGTYGWVDRSAGVVRIPIEQAMARLAASPPPAVPPGGTP